MRSRRRLGFRVTKAGQLGDETLREWKRRGGEQEYVKDNRKVIPMVAGTFGLAALGLLAVVAVGVWLATRIF